MMSIYFAAADAAATATTCDNKPPTPWIELVPHNSGSPRPIPSPPPSYRRDPTMSPTRRRDPTLSPTTVGQRTRPPSEGGGGGGGSTPSPTAGGSTSSPTAGGITPSPTPVVELCVGALVFCGLRVGFDNQPWCGSDGMPEEWGWSNFIGSGEICYLGMNMTGCDTEAGEDVGKVEVLVDSNRFNVTMADGWFLKAYHVSS
jgi:hypothetical protein